MSALIKIKNWARELKALIRSSRLPGAAATSDLSDILDMVATGSYLIEHACRGA